MSFRRYILLLLVLFSFGPMASAQGHVRRAMERARQRQEEMARKHVSEEAPAKPQGAGYMNMLVVDGDTTYIDHLRPVYVFGQRGKNSEKKWREYYKLVWRFARVYPYALASGGLKRQVDSTLNATGYKGIRRQMYIDAIQKQLFKDFGGALHDMTIQQGALLLKLICRETGVPPYDIIHDYKSGAAAGFWQAIAKFFDNDLHSQYDPNGADAATEQLVWMWERGEFPGLYWSVFWEDPPVVKVPDVYFK